MTRTARASTIVTGVGARVRELRTARGLTLRAAAEQAQISASLLSQIERGDASPSLVSLVAIADALVVSPGELLREDGDQDSGSPVVRAGERHVIDDPGCRREYLMHLDDPYVEFAELHVAPGGATRPALARHAGRDYAVVCEGELWVEFADHREHLRTGDYIAFEGSERHRLVNLSEAPARAFWIVLLRRTPQPRPQPRRPR